MEYKITTTDIFERWLKNIRSTEYRARITKRIRKMSLGHFGDYKLIRKNLYELRFFFGSGYRVYYAKRGNEVILLLCGGDKSTQQQDIEKAVQIMQALELE